jgi:hypothetical protein
MAEDGISAIWNAFTGSVCSVNVGFTSSYYIYILFSLGKSEGVYKYLFSLKYTGKIKLVVRL